MPFTGFHFPAEAITVAVRWYLRYGSSIQYGLDRPLTFPALVVLPSATPGAARREPAGGAATCLA